VILSHEHRFIYIRCRKTASTSTEVALSRICGPNDIITTMLRCPEDEVLRRQSEAADRRTASIVMAQSASTTT